MNQSSTKLSAFAKNLLSEWRKLDLPQSNASIIVAVSGGADSVALLFALHELIKTRKLKVKIVIAHLNHKLRGKASDADARWVTRISKRLDHQVAISSVNVQRHAAKSGDNLEQAARRARYEFLKKTAKAKNARLIVTAHSVDDQAETILLNLLRGSGADGLAGIEPLRPIEPRSKILLARPLLSWATHSDTEGYCRKHSIDFRVDEMNADETYARVRVRRQLIPLMKTFNPKFVEGITRTAEILREDSTALDAAALRLVELSADDQVDSKGKNLWPSLSLDLLRMAQPALRRRALRRWIALHRGDLRRLERVHIAAVDSLIFNVKSGPIVELPGGASVLRTGGRLHYRRTRSKGQK